MVDAGSKALASDGAGVHAGNDWFRVFGRPDLTMDFISEEHGVGRSRSGAAPATGDQLELVPNHICPVLNLFDKLVGIRGGQVKEHFTVAGRGRSR